MVESAHATLKVIAKIMRGVKRVFPPSEPAKKLSLYNQAAVKTRISKHNNHARNEHQSRLIVLPPATGF